jgi:hypothetical protein
MNENPYASPTAETKASDPVTPSPYLLLAAFLFFLIGTHFVLFMLPGWYDPRMGHVGFLSNGILAWACLCFYYRDWRMILGFPLMAAALGPLSFMGYSDFRIYAPWAVGNFLILLGCIGTRQKSPALDALLGIAQCLPLAVHAAYDLLLTEMDYFFLLGMPTSYLVQAIIVLMILLRARPAN